MKLKFPKEIEIEDYVFKVEYDKTKGGGFFSFSDRKIGIGTIDLKKNPRHVFAIICHELIEVISVLRDVRYDDPHVLDDYKFFMDHRQFTSVVGLFASVVKNFIK